ncbi:MAG: serine hydrolase domain-containing protein [Armatimonadota bacterium]
MKVVFLTALAAACLAAVVASAAPEPPKIPETPAGKRFAELLKAHASGKPEVIREALEQASPGLPEDRLQRRVEVMLAFRGQVGDVDLLRIQADGEHSVTGDLRSRLTEETRRVRIDVEPQPPHAIRTIMLQPVDAEPGEAPRDWSDAELEREVGAFVKRLADAGRFSGAVLVAKNGKPLYREAFGLANRAYQVPNRPDTKFNLGSMNKMFTAVAIGQLVERGKLRFEDTVGTHLPQFPNKDVREKVTIHQLLSHTSGMGSYFNQEFMESSRDRFRSVADYEPLYAFEKLQFEPGKGWAYSNSGFMLLGAILEKVTGQSYFDYVRENIYRPAGMTNTDAYEMDSDTPNLAYGYTKMGPTGPTQEWRNNLYLHVIKGGPAGGGFSTVDDLLQFGEALRSHKLLSAETTERMFRKQSGDQPQQYGYGFQLGRNPGEVGHSGGFPGISSELNLYLRSGYTVAVLSNIDQGAPPVVEKLRRMLSRP